jgi:hypothetical protein
LLVAQSNGDYRKKEWMFVLVSERDGDKTKEISIKLTLVFNYIVI